MTLKEAAGGIIVGQDGKIVLVNQHNNSWSFPKGSVEEGENTLDAAKREIAEESGIRDLTLISELGSYERYSIGKDGIGEQTDWGLRKRTIFLFTTHQTAFATNDPDGEISEARWVTIDEALSLLTHPKDSVFLASVRTKVEDALK